MQRREFTGVFYKLATSVGAPALVATPLSAVAASSSVLLEISPTPGFQYHQSETARLGPKVNLPPTLRCEPGNRYDTRAVEVRAGAHKLGHEPRVDNIAVRQITDRGDRQAARNVPVESSSNPSKRVRFELQMETW